MENEPDISECLTQRHFTVQEGKTYCTNNTHPCKYRLESDSIIIDMYSAKNDWSKERIFRCTNQIINQECIDNVLSVPHDFDFKKKDSKRP